MARKPFYPNLEAELARLGVTHEELAAELGVKGATLSPVMTGKTRMTLDTAQRIRDYVVPGESLDYLFAREPIVK